MADLNAKNYQLIQNNPSEALPKGELNGKIKTMYDEITLSAELSVNDEILLYNLPAGARVVEALISGPSLGTTGIISLGHKANNEDAEDDDAFIASADMGGQAVKENIPAGAAGLLKKFASETQIFAKCSEASDAGSGQKIQFLISFVVD
jgi:hypothetical protein